ncbi:carboxymuconolactone decarboxylase family protein [Dyadobacter sp. LHD-138]|uniref:carboxymuconolactone decarboxylase family protein n=1 Tax=Dyadobacter sp. LHD-138 TaxID=3071413 RepID=UPI0027E1B810|nr:carboxymuconolactone decarboxylase family protein [Dyadobacter sp. LHD-138]MDQ6477112.1 carboxymuconolactone decarboxylase family protein [Dyadobacter sp. LHD-138]
MIISAFVSYEVNADSKNFETNSLDAKQQSIVAIAAFTAKGDLPGLKQALSVGLKAGLTINEIKEELVHLSAYCGFPRSLNGINTFNAVLNERKSKGIADTEGPKPSKVADTNKYQTGKKVLESLTGRPETGPKTGYAAFVPAIDTLLKEHLFNDIFTRGVLDHKQRELTTVSALVLLGGVESQLGGHLGICLHLGFTEQALRQVLSIIEINIGKKEADAGRQVLERIKSARK